DINEEKVPDEVTTLLWIGSPNLTDLGMYHIDQFLMKGGNLVILAKTVDFQLQSKNQYNMMGMGGQPNVATPTKENAKISEFTKHYGFVVKPEMVLEPDSAMPMGPLVQVEPGVIGRYHYPLWVIASRDGNGLSKDSIFTKDMQYLLLPWVSGIDTFADNQKGAKIHTLIQSTKEAGRNAEYIMIGESQVESQEITANGKPIPLGIHVEGSLTSYFKAENLPEKANKETFLAKTLEGKKSQIVTIGSPYLISDILAVNREFIEVFRETNIPFVLNMLDVLSGDTDLLEARSKSSVIFPLKPIPKPYQIVLSFFNILLFPILISIYAFIRIKRRTRAVKQ
ncbi:MAG: Gldg family protein, partial [Leptospiraceae bacterium]|nr:Gldg family protein [Leptospiraceae bacterium]